MHGVAVLPSKSFVKPFHRDESAIGPLLTLKYVSRIAAHYLKRGRMTMGQNWMHRKMWSGHLYSGNCTDARSWGVMEAR